MNDISEKRVQAIANARRGTAELAPLNGAYKKTPELDEERIRYHIQTRFNPIRGLTPQVLVRRLDDLSAGDLRECMMTWDAIARRDGTICNVRNKRTAAAARQPWQIALTEKAEDNPLEADAQKAMLEYFYNNLTVTQALERDINGGVQQLIRQTMAAVGMKYAVHETVWKPTEKGLTATLIQVPNWFFERRTGKLRYLNEDFAIEGIDMQPGGWSVAVHEGIMEATSVCFIFKTMPLKDWASYCEIHSSKGIFGKTDAPEASEQWQALADAVSKISTGLTGIINTKDEIDQLKFASEGTLPYEPLVDRMDRAISSLWRGADLSTMSARGNNDGAGASLQGGEMDEIVGDDCAFISEVFQQNYDRLVLEWAFGPGVEPLAYFSLGGAKKVDVETEIKVDEFFLKAGIPMGVRDTLERYGRSQPADDDELVSGGGMGGAPGMGGGLFDQSTAAIQQDAAGMMENEKLSRVQLQRMTTALAGAQQKALEPIAKRMAHALQLTNEDEFKASLRQLREDLPGYLLRINANPKTAKVFAEILKESFILGSRSRK